MLGCVDNADSTISGHLLVVVVFVFVFVFVHYCLFRKSHLCILVNLHRWMDRNGQIHTGVKIK